MTQAASFDPAKFKGYQYPDKPVAYNTRDLILYALGIGVSDLRYTYELDKKFAAFPTYALVLGLKGDHQSVNSYAEMSKGSFDIPGFPKIDLNKLVHGDMSYELLAPLPTQGGKFTLKSNLAGVYDAGKGMVIEIESFLVDQSGTKLARMVSSAFVIGAGGFGGGKRPPPALFAAKPSRAPDFTSTSVLRPDQALLYRLSGDYNPLHADPSIGKRLGMKGAFLHGLCTMGFASAAVVKEVAGGDGSGFVAVAGRFASPVYPGETLTTRMWKVAEENGVVTVAYEAAVGERVVIAGGVVKLKVPAAGAKL
ncbi:hypothetical protein HDU96_009474 [Phlyctochytrium bullatum]|nr:hypothetical protein HDU96_009474 [Phlyctochytrium bullatum]